jgi:hypothetical protein
LKEEKETRQATTQLAKDLEITNLLAPSLKPSAKQTKVIVSKAKKIIPIVLKTEKVFLKANLTKRMTRSKVSNINPVLEIVEKVVAINHRGRTIKLLTRFK